MKGRRAFKSLLWVSLILMLAAIPFVGSYGKTTVAEAPNSWPTDGVFLYGSLDKASGELYLVLYLKNISPENVYEVKVVGRLSTEDGIIIEEQEVSFGDITSGEVRSGEFLFVIPEGEEQFQLNFIESLKDEYGATLETEEPINFIARAYPKDFNEDTREMTVDLLLVNVMSKEAKEVSAFATYREEEVGRIFLGDVGPGESLSGDLTITLPEDFDVSIPLIVHIYMQETDGNCCFFVWEKPKLAPELFVVIAAARVVNPEDYVSCHPTENNFLFEAIIWNRAGRLGDKLTTVGYAVETYTAEDVKLTFDHCGYTRPVPPGDEYNDLSYEESDKHSVLIPLECVEVQQGVVVLQQRLKYKWGGFGIPISYKGASLTLGMPPKSKDIPTERRIEFATPDIKCTPNDVIIGCASPAAWQGAEAASYQHNSVVPLAALGGLVAIWALAVIWIKRRR